MKSYLYRVVKRSDGKFQLERYQVGYGMLDWLLDRESWHVRCAYGLDVYFSPNLDNPSAIKFGSEQEVRGMLDRWKAEDGPVTRDEVVYETVV